MTMAEASEINILTFIEHINDVLGLGASPRAALLTGDLLQRGETPHLQNACKRTFFLASRPPADAWLVAGWLGE